MKIIVALMMLSVASLSSADVRERPSEQELIRVFLECPDIISAQKDLSKGAKAGKPEILLYDSLCGAAGCQYSALVAQRFERRKADPFVTHLFGRVFVGPKNEITRVERVVMVLFRDLAED